MPSELTLVKRRRRERILTLWAPPYGLSSMAIAERVGVSQNHVLQTVREAREKKDLRAVDRKHNKVYYG